MTTTHTPTTTERYLHAVRDVVIARATARGTITATQADQLAHVKLLYGVGDGTYRGITAFQAWENGVVRVDVIEIAATGQESWIQLAGTVIHELGHVLAGAVAGHSGEWKEAAVALGFGIRPAAAGQVYSLSMIDPVVRFAVHTLAQQIGDGRPEFRTRMRLGTTATTPRPCSAGIGTKGGKSRGKGSGSRMRLWECACPRPVKVRVASDSFAAHCDECGTAFTRRDQAASEAA